MTTSSTETTVPLTSEQQAWLRANVMIPAATLVGLLIVGLGLGSCLIGRFATAPFVPFLAIGTGVLIVIVALLVGRYTRQHYADMRLGVAYVRDAVLVRKDFTTQSPRTFFTEFEGIGTLNVLYEVYEPLVVGQRYHVVYSPHTKRAWAVNALTYA